LNCQALGGGACCDPEKRMKFFARGNTPGKRDWIRLVVALSMVLAMLPPAGAEPVIDDEKIEGDFVRGIQRQAKRGQALTGRQVRAALAEAKGRKVPAATLAPGRPAGEAVARYERAREAVVIVGSIEKCTECSDWHMGAVSSGWLAGPDGLVATNYHVLEEDSDEPLGVMFSDGAVYGLREVVAADEDGDVALVRVDVDGEHPWLPLAAAVRTGEPVHLVSHPDGRFYSLTEGIVSRVFMGSLEEGAGRRTWVTVSADYGSGSSGAPVLNDGGEVVGMVSSTATLLADPEDGQEARAEDVQMVFKDCVAVQTIRALME